MSTNGSLYQDSEELLSLYTLALSLSKHVEEIKTHIPVLEKTLVNINFENDLTDQEIKEVQRSIQQIQSQLTQMALHFKK
ncbi:hypothetical protein [Pleionea sp. CnH1-48]|uniref:hypothetical protein n=1 Tax=Pleionea sp. CnH1-48 TaxID=2954494 RepID=UPI002097F058|nr:hypothetical protein [Pleionea sp. CnH1-48]MCO7227008.1 hypothetical protein [Pleionea sp. CnH1-48]